MWKFLCRGGPQPSANASLPNGTSVWDYTCIHDRCHRQFAEHPADFHGKRVSALTTIYYALYTTWFIHVGCRFLHPFLKLQFGGNVQFGGNLSISQHISDCDRVLIHSAMNDLQYDSMIKMHVKSVSKFDNPGTTSSFLLCLQKQVRSTHCF